MISVSGWASSGLKVAPDKTRILRFCRFDLNGSGRFDFLGFEDHWERTRAGRLGVKRRTSRKKLRASLANMTDWIRRNRSLRVGQLLSILCAKYRGYWNYYGVIGNSASSASSQPEQAYPVQVAQSP